jgi:H+/gluconate symporter-like permease
MFQSRAGSSEGAAGASPVQAEQKPPAPAPPAATKPAQSFPLALIVILAAIVVVAIALILYFVMKRWRRPRMTPNTESAILARILEADEQELTPHAATGFP